MSSNHSHSQFSSSEILIQIYYHAGICVVDCRSLARRRSQGDRDQPVALSDLQLLVSAGHLLVPTRLGPTFFHLGASNLRTSSRMHVHGILREIDSVT
jgi:hypothetical protein